MLRRRWIPHLFFIAFAMSLVHHILPHSHKKENSGTAEKATSSHHHDSDHHSHSHPQKSKNALPVFTHFSNGEFIGSAKYSFKSKLLYHVPIIEQPIIISVALPILSDLPSPVPHARDLPLKFILSIQSLRAPPEFVS